MPCEGASYVCAGEFAGTIGCALLCAGRGMDATTAAYVGGDGDGTLWSSTPIIVMVE